MRLAGQYLLRPGDATYSVGLYIGSFVATMLFVRGVCRWMGWERRLWVRAAGLMVLPTLVLDPFSCAFFSSVFPNIEPAAAGVFGGWMLMCCGGGVAGGLFRS